MAPMAPVADGGAPMKAAGLAADVEGVPAAPAAGGDGERKSNAEPSAGCDGGGAVAARSPAAGCEGGGVAIIMPIPSKSPIAGGAGAAAIAAGVAPPRAGVTSAAIHISASKSVSALRERTSSPERSSMRVGSEGAHGSTHAVAPCAPRSSDHFGWPPAASLSVLK